MREREPLHSWEIASNYLMLHVRFSPQLGEKPCEINVALGTHAPQQTELLDDLVGAGEY